MVLNLAREFHYRVALIDYDESDDEWWLYGSTWVLLSRDERLIESGPIHNACSALSTNASKVPLWTDDFASLFQILR